jgi:hypothetical protein
VHTPILMMYVIVRHWFKILISGDLVALTVLNGAVSQVNVPTMYIMVH